MNNNKKCILRRIVETDEGMKQKIYDFMIGRINTNFSIRCFKKIPKPFLMLSSVKILEIQMDLS